MPPNLFQEYGYCYSFINLKYTYSSRKETVRRIDRHKPKVLRVAFRGFMKQSVQVLPREPRHKVDDTAAVGSGDPLTLNVLAVCFVGSSRKSISKPPSSSTICKYLDPTMDDGIWSLGVGCYMYCVFDWPLRF